MFFPNPENMKLRYFVFQGLSRSMEETKSCKLYRFLNLYKNLLQILWLVTIVCGVMIFSGAYVYHKQYNEIQKDYFTQNYHEILFNEYHQYPKCDKDNNPSPASYYVAYGMVLSVTGVLFFIFQSILLHINTNAEIHITMKYRPKSTVRVRRLSSSSDSTSYEYTVMRTSLKYFGGWAAFNSMVFLLIFTLLENSYCLDPPTVSCNGFAPDKDKLKKWSDSRIFLPTEKGVYYLTWDYQQRGDTCCVISNSKYEPEYLRRLIDKKDKNHQSNIFSCMHKCGDRYESHLWQSTKLDCDGGFKLEYLKSNYDHGCKATIEKHYKAVNDSHCTMYYSHKLLLAGIYIIFANAACSIFVTFLVITSLVYIPN